VPIAWITNQSRDMQYFQQGLCGRTCILVEVKLPTLYPVEGELRVASFLVKRFL